jgi:hypothetical protein
MTRLITRRSVIAAGAAAERSRPADLHGALAFGGTREFSFTYISDSHIQQIKGASFVRNWDMGLKRAVAEPIHPPEADFSCSAAISRSSASRRSSTTAARCFRM